VHNRQVKNIFFSLLYRSGAIASNFLIVPLIINQFSETEYGILVTVLSITTWFTFIDFGLANGLKNKISESLAKGEEGRVRKYVSTAYGTLFKAVAGIVLLLLAINYFFDWNKIIKAPEYAKSEVNHLFFYGLLLFLIKILIELINPILLAYHKTSISSLITFISQISILAVCYLYKSLNDHSLTNYGLAFFWVPLLTVIVFSLYYFIRPFKNIRPSFKFFEKSYEKDLLRLGGSFLVIQIAVVIIFTTDNLIVGWLFGYDEVSKYNIAFRYFNIPVLILTIALMPYWPLFAEWFATNKTFEIKQTMKRLLGIWLIVALIAIIMLILANPVYRVWVGPKISVPFLLSLGMCLFCIISGWGSVYATFINSTNKLRLQLYSCVVTGIINIPVSVFLAKYTSLGSAGVIFGTCVCLLIGGIWAPVQYHRLVNNRAKGIWNK
jgi:O-antigen/teichoic acid export membrane protein